MRADPFLLESLPTPPYRRRLRDRLPKSPVGLALFAAVAFVAHLAIEGAIVLFVLYVVAK